MLYLDYGASHPGQWVPNEHGGREDLEAITFLRELCDRVHRRFPGAIVVAEESTAWPGVTRPTYLGGLGFDFKWNMGWMHDTLDYMKLDPIHRAFHHGKLTFGLMYAFSERFVLPLSHDEVVHLKKSLLSKMPGDAWKMAASLRLYYAYMWAHPGKKLLFMGGEIGQWAEWNEATGLDWHLLEDPRHQGIQRLVRDANRLYVERAALHELDDRPDGFSWIDPSDAPQSVASFVRYAAEPPREEPPKQEPPGEEPPRADLGDPVAPVGEIRKEGGGLPPPSREERRGPHVVFIGNFTPIPRRGYRVGVPGAGRYREVLNTDAREYGGSGVGNLGAVEVEDVPSHGFARSIVLSLPPLGALWLEPEEGAAS
jgi:1,4-alpha-glucan branching enzyme